jgi:hypothetical protein
MVAYAEFRGAFNNCTEDSRIIFYGIEYIIRRHLSKPWTMDELEKSSRFTSTHGVSSSPFPFPKELLEEVCFINKMINGKNGLEMINSKNELKMINNKNENNIIQHQISI